MAAELVREGEQAAAVDPGLAFEVWVALERAGQAPPDAPFAPPALVDAPRRRVDALLAGIGDRALRERALELVRVRRDDWREVYFDRLGKEDDPRVLDLIADALQAEAGGEPPRDLDRLLDGVVAQPHRQPPLFVWLAERAAADVHLRSRNPLRLLQQILSASNREELNPYRQRLKVLAEAGGTLPRLLPELTEDQASAARDAVHRAALLEVYQREALARALEIRFPALRDDRPGGTHVLHALPASIAAKHAELDHLTRVELPANRKAIQEARAMGDLRENFEYKAARQRHEVLSALATRLHGDLSRARPLDLSTVDPSQVRVGTVVRLATAGGDRTVTLLGPWESDPERGVISYESELGQSLLGKAVGDAVEVEGKPATVQAIAVAAG
jgi:transcription elongation GreA/GreB family factor